MILSQVLHNNFNIITSCLCSLVNALSVNAQEEEKKSHQYVLVSGKHQQWPLVRLSLERWASLAMDNSIHPITHSVERKP